MRIHRRKLLLVAFLAVVGAAVWLASASAQTGSFANQTPITINDGTCNTNITAPTAQTTPATPYPSTINVAGLVGTVNKVTASLFSYSHTFPDDVDILLVGPTGTKTILMADAGGPSPGVSNVNVTFDDAAAGSIPDNANFASGTYKPTVGTMTGLPGDCGHPVNWPAPAPASPYSTTLSAFNGSNPNGVWSLYVIDDAAIDTGLINGGWSLTITTNAGTLTVTKNLVSNPADPGKFNLLIDNVVLAACVGNGGTTGPIVEAPNTFHTVSETACAGTNLGNYTPSISCSNGAHSGGTSLVVFVGANANVSCVIRNQRKLFRVGGT